MPVTLNSIEPLFNVFQRLNENLSKERISKWEIRRDSLKKLKKLIRDSSIDISTAISNDFGYRNPIETQLTDIIPSLLSINHALDNIKSWMKPQKRKTHLLFKPGVSRIHYQPLGIVGIIVPWNCPLYLSISPLVSALAAGNTVMIKLPENTPAFNELFADLLNKFGLSEVIIPIIGNHETAIEFVNLPFKKLLYTGSTVVGREILKSASLNMTPIILELGGKSPVIVDLSADFQETVSKILFAKALNAGQICVAPDHVFVHHSQLNLYVQEFKKAYQDMYANGAYQHSELINEAAIQRYYELINDAIAKGAEVQYLDDNYHVDNSGPRPILILHATGEMRIMKEEIFGPILPILSYDVLDQVFESLQASAHPLALYYFGKKQKHINYITTCLQFGGATINDCLIHLLQDDMPFGGIGDSGIGRYHGIEGFISFSNPKSVFVQSRFSLTSLLKPPYNRFKINLINKVINWL